VTQPDDWIVFASASHEGAIRQENEDACLFRAASDIAIAVVADGMGGSRTGRPAADITTKTAGDALDTRMRIYAEAWWAAEHAEPGSVAWSEVSERERDEIEAHVRELRRTREPRTLGDLALVEREGEVLDLLAKRVLVDAHRAILSHIVLHPMQRGMGATAATAVFASGWAALAHVGDARIYRLRDEGLELLTKDHNLLNEFIANGKLVTQEEIEGFPHRKIIVRALGLGESVEVDTRVVATKRGDLFLLCSDGISDTFDDDFLRRALGERRTGAATFLVGMACNAAENDDNVTALVAELR
jgi:serine/threonine protein phosphatase PrpC